jgi:hypothetical protein
VFRGSLSEGQATRDGEWMVAGIFELRKIRGTGLFLRVGIKRRARDLAGEARRVVGGAEDGEIRADCGDGSLLFRAGQVPDGVEADCRYWIYQFHKRRFSKRLDCGTGFWGNWKILNCVEYRVNTFNVET